MRKKEVFALQSVINSYGIFCDRRIIIKRLLTILLLLSVFFIGCGVKVEAESYEEWNYSILQDGTVEIMKYNGSEANVVIPESIVGRDVTIIDYNAFSYNEQIVTVLIPAGIKGIGSYYFDYDGSSGSGTYSSTSAAGFYGCKNLEEINVDSNNPNYKSEDGVLFNYDKSMLIYYPSGKKEENYQVPANVYTVRYGAFSRCTYLKNVEFQESLNNFCDDNSWSIGASIFYECDNLENIKISENNLNFSSIDGMLYNKDQSELLFCPAGKEGEINSIPDTVTSMEIVYCDKITSVTVPQNVTYISDMNAVGSKMFYGCSNLKEINVDEDNQTYSSVDGLLYDKEKNILLLCPEGREGIVDSIPNSVLEIEAYAFEKCKYITQICVPESVKSIQRSEGFYFDGCENLEILQVDKNNLLYSSVDGILYDKQQKQLIFCPIAKAGKVNSIPESVVEIGDSAFLNCSKITFVSLPESTVSVGQVAFEGCTSLEEVIFPEGLTKISYGAFGDCYNLKSVTLPKTIKTIEGTALGMVDLEWEERLNEGFVLYGYTGTVAESYAKRVGCEFVSLGIVSDDESGVTTEESSTQTKPSDYLPVQNSPVNNQNDSGKTVEKRVEVSSLHIEGISNRIASGKKIKLALKAYPENADASVIWTSSNPKIATVSQDGTVSFKKKSAGKTVIITATAANGVQTSFRVKSMKGIVKKVTIDGAKKKTVKAGKKLKLKVKVTATKGANKKLIWTSSNTKFATVTASGKVKTKKAGKGKKVKITAMATDGSNKKTTVVIRIK